MVILHTNDVRCALNDKIGYDGLYLYEKEMEQKYENVLLADAGDAIQGGEGSQQNQNDRRPGVIRLWPLGRQNVNDPGSVRASGFLNPIVFPAEGIKTMRPFAKISSCGDLAHLMKSSTHGKYKKTAPYRDSQRIEKRLLVVWF